MSNRGAIPVVPNPNAGIHGKTEENDDEACSGCKDALSLDRDVLAIAGTKAFGVDRATMSGWDMVQSRRGVAVQVREVELRGEA